MAVATTWLFKSVVMNSFNGMVCVYLLHLPDLRRGFGDDATPDLTRVVYIGIHSGSARLLPSLPSQRSHPPLGQCCESGVDVLIAASYGMLLRDSTWFGLQSLI